MDLMRRSLVRVLSMSRAPGGPDVSASLATQLVFVFCFKQAFLRGLAKLNWSQTEAKLGSVVTTAKLSFFARMVGPSGEGGSLAAIAAFVMADPVCCLGFLSCLARFAVEVSCG